MRYTVGMSLSHRPPAVSAEEAVSVVQSGHRVYIHGMAATPVSLIEALAAQAPRLKDVEIVHLHTEGPAPYAEPGMEEHFFVNNLFIGANLRPAVDAGRADYIPVFLSEIPALFRRGILPLDVAMVSVTPPDAHGYCSMGVSVDCSLAALQSASVVIAEINPHMPRTHGDGNIHISRFNKIVEVDRPLGEHPPETPTEIEFEIGRRVAALIEDGSTLQMGIGTIPNAVLASLTGHRHLGIHTEMFSDGVVDLVERGVIDNSRKLLQHGKTVSGFVSGSKRLYDFVDDNPSVLLRDIAYVNDTTVIRRQPKMTAINSAIEIDLTGQVCADSIGTRQFSGVGGQMDFVRGATLSEGGKPIFALPARTNRGQTRIVPTLKVGAGVVTTRAHVRYVVTEFGVADLYGKNLRQRATELIQCAHPEDREMLERAAFERFHR